jgi:hypothetical protein
VVIDAFELAGQPEIDTRVITFPDPSPDSISIIKRLSAALLNRAGDMNKYDAYYRGDHGLRFASSKYREQFGKMFGKYAENVCALVVDSVEERLDVEGFIFPRTDTPAEADPDAWRIWQDNGLDAKSQTAHTEALVKGVAYVLVSPFESEFVAKRSPKITIEDPLETIVEYDAGTRERLVGMKRWTDQTVKRTFATLFFPDRIEKWQSTNWTDLQGNFRDSLGRFAANETWEHRPVADEAWPLPHQLGVVPLVPLVNKPRLLGEGESELRHIVPLQDAINKIAVDGLVASDASAFRQKWATGIEIPIDPDTGKMLEPFKPDIDRIIATTAEDAKFGNFEASDSANYTGQLDQKYQAVATISGTPFHYFMQHSGQPPSGDSLRGGETRLTRKADRRTKQFGEGWEEVERLAFRVLDDPRADVFDAEAIWAPTETMTESEHIDAAGKRRTMLKVPLKQLWKDAGYSPGEIASFQRLLEEERTWLDSTPVATTQPAALPEPKAPTRLVVTKSPGSTSISSEPA